MIEPGIKLRQGVRSTLIGVFANSALVAVKLVAGVLGNSYALIADAVESALDVLGSLVVWGGLRVSLHPPDENHPYGHGKAEALATLFISLMLVLAAVGLAVESIREIRTPHSLPEPFTLIVLVAVIVIKEVLFRYVFAVSEVTASGAVAADAWHHRSDALTSAAAFIGISLALYKGEGWETADDWAALFACAIIAWNGYRLFTPALAEVMDATPNLALEGSIRRIAGAVEGVESLDKCYVRKYGTVYVVDLHVRVNGNETVTRGHAIAHAVKDALQRSELKIHDALIHVEPQPVASR